MKNKAESNPLGVSGSPHDRRRGVKATIYLLPNMITAASLFFGFLCIRFATEGEYLFAAYCILAAGVCDGLDGSVARLTRTQSEFGVQLDSLCDLVAFGVAPAWLAYQYGADEFGRLGFAACFSYLACGALRLARFNVATAVGKASGNFSGIPIPIAAACVSVFVMLNEDIQAWVNDGALATGTLGVWFENVLSVISQSQVKNISLIILLFIVASGMISTFEYLSTKRIKLPRKRPFRVLAGILVGTVILASIDLTVTLFITLFVYALHGPFLALIYKRDQSDEEEEIFTGWSDEEEEQGSAQVLEATIQNNRKNVTTDEGSRHE